MNLRWVEEKKVSFPSPDTPVEIKHLEVAGDICIVWQGAQISVGSYIVERKCPSCREQA